MDKQTVSLAISELVPEIIRGVHLDFFAQRPITQTQFMMLLAIRSGSDCSMGQLARNSHITMPTVTGIVGRLQQLGLVKRKSNEKDRRHVLVSLTPKGERFILEFKRIVRERWTGVLSGLDAGEQSQLYAIITKLQKHLKSGGRTP